MVLIPASFQVFPAVVDGAMATSMVLVTSVTGGVLDCTTTPVLGSATSITRMVLCTGITSKWERGTLYVVSRISILLTRLRRPDLLKTLTASPPHQPPTPVHSRHSLFMCRLTIYNSTKGAGQIVSLKTNLIDPQNAYSQFPIAYTLHTKEDYPQRR